MLSNSSWDEGWQKCFQMVKKDVFSCFRYHRKTLHGETRKKTPITRLEIDNEYLVDTTPHPPSSSKDYDPEADDLLHSRRGSRATLPCKPLFQVKKNLLKLYFSFNVIFILNILCILTTIYFNHNVFIESFVERNNVIRTFH